MSNKTAKNDITGDWIKSKPTNDMFGENFDRIFRQKKEETITHKDETRIDIVGQNGNDGLHYEYELDKSTGEVIKKDN